jgi:microcystin-dependent protein
MVDGCIGEVRFFAGNFAPRDWAFCNGQLLAISSYTALFSILGTTYGGDGRSTMGLPDLRGRMPVSPGTGPGLPTVTLGQQFGSHQTQLVANNLPSHTHGFSLTATSEAGNSADPTGAVLANAGLFDNEFHSAPTAGNEVQMAANTTSAAGAGIPFNNYPPSLGVHAVICLFGVFPSRN